MGVFCALTAGVISVALRPVPAARIACPIGTGDVSAGAWMDGQHNLADLMQNAVCLLDIPGRGLTTLVWQIPLERGPPDIPLVQLILGTGVRGHERL